MMSVYEAVVARLATLGYTSTEADRVSLEYLIPKCELDILANINHRELPDGLFYTLVEMAAEAGFAVDEAAFHIEMTKQRERARAAAAPAVPKMFAGASDGSSSAESRFDALLDRMMHPPESTLARFRRLRW